MLVGLVPHAFVLIPEFQGEGTVEVTLLCRLVPIEGVGVLWEIASLLL